MIWLAVKLVTGRALAVLRTIPPLWLAIALCGAVAAFCWHGWHKSHVALQACQAGRAADRAAYTAAQVEATRIATAAKVAIEAKQETARKDADAKLDTARRDANARLADWMRRQTAKGHSGSPDLSGTANAAQVDNEPGAGAFMVEASDLAICTDNTVRLQNARDWAAGLVK